jgi:hypothetical protein
MLTPTKSTFDILNQFEKKSVENNKIYFEYMQKQRQEGYDVIDEYFKLARKTQERFTFHLEDGFKVFASSAK